MVLCLFTFYIAIEPYFIVLFGLYHPNLFFFFVRVCVTFFQVLNLWALYMDSGVIKIEIQLAQLFPELLAGYQANQLSEMSNL